MGKPSAGYGTVVTDLGGNRKRWLPGRKETMAAALILSGGTGTRLGADIPKQYIKIYGRSVISFCIEALAGHEGIDSIQIVAARQWQDFVLRNIREYDHDGKFCGFSDPGENRQLSIYSGLRDIRDYTADSGVVLIHDAARPLVSARMITDCLHAVKGHDGVLPVLPVKDTVYKSTDGMKVGGLLNRSEIYAGQAPEAFLIGRYYEANRRLLPDKIREINGSAEPAVMAGMDIVMIPGDEENIKITTREDLQRFAEITKRTGNGR